MTWQRSNYSPNSTFVLRKAMSTRPPSKTSKGLFEPMVMFFGLTNSPATFQIMIDNIFQEEVVQG